MKGVVEKSDRSCSTDHSTNGGLCNHCSNLRLLAFKHNLLSIMDVLGERQERLRKERLGRVAKVTVEPSCLGCTGRPPAQRDASYRSEGFLSSENLGGITWVLIESKRATVRTPPLERTRTSRSCQGAFAAQGRLVPAAHRNC